MGSSTTASRRSGSWRLGTRNRFASRGSQTATKRSTRTSGSTAKSREVYEIIVIGTSWGGLDGGSRLLDGLHDDVHQPIIIAQHRSVESEEGGLARLLAFHTSRMVSDPDDKT